MGLGRGLQNLTPFQWCFQQNHKNLCDIYRIHTSYGRTWLLESVGFSHRLFLRTQTRIVADDFCPRILPTHDFIRIIRKGSHAIFVDVPASHTRIIIDTTYEYVHIFQCIAKRNVIVAMAEFYPEQVKTSEFRPGGVTRSRAIDRLCLRRTRSHW